MAIRYLKFTDNNDNDGAVAVADTLIFQEGGTALTQNQDHNALAAGGLTSVFIRRPWKGNIGSAANPFIAEISTGSSAKFEIDGGGGECWYEPRGTANFCDLLRVQGLMQVHVLGVGTITRMENKASWTDVASAIIVPALFNTGSATTKILNSGSAVRPLSIDVENGLVESQRGVNGTIKQSGGACEIDAGAEVVTTWELLGGVGMIVSMGDPGTLTWTRGIFDVTKLKRIIAPGVLNISLPNIEADDWLKFRDHPLVDLSSTTINTRYAGAA